jgi:hypothetical protein
MRNIDPDKAGAHPGAKTGQKLIQAAELNRALTLCDAMIELQQVLDDAVSINNEDLKVFATLVKEELIPWPQLGDLERHLSCLVEASSYDANEEHVALTKDLAIWIVEHCCRPASPDQVRELRPELQKAGTGFVLYSCFERHRVRLDGAERRLFQSLFEGWINSIWDGAIRLPLPETLHTVGQLITWLEETGPVPIHRQITHVIVQLKTSEA